MNGWTGTLAVGCMLGMAGGARALQSVPVGSGFVEPVFLTAPAGDARLFIVEKAGRIQLLQGGTTSTYLDIRGLVDAAGERGLLGLAFDPNFASNGRFYVDYIDKSTHNTVVAAYTAPSAASNTADPSSAKLIIGVTQPGDSNHKAGWIGFRGSDPGQLYIATGDGGSANDPNNRAQNLTDNLGKLLRVTPLAGGGYTVPAGNPFAGATPGNDEIWSFGLRNPYRNSVDRMTGDLWIADVGQGLREELNFELAGTLGGRNYGWRAREGSIDNPNVGDPSPPGAIDPMFDYPHGAMGGTIIGGYVYRGNGEPGLDGTYFFGDHNSGKIFTLRQQGGVASGLTERTAELGSLFGGFTLSSFGEDGLGNLYVMGLNGNVYRIASAVPEPGAWTLLASGLVLIGFLRRRRTRAPRA
jgi:glucose/arabinose dehydrogenase